MSTLSSIPKFKNAKPIHFLALMAAAAVLLISPSAHALMRRSTLAQRLLQADDVVIGTVIERHAELTRVKHLRMIATTVRLRVDHALRAAASDPAPSELVIHVPGGQIDHLRLDVSDTPTFQEGERVVLLLKRLQGPHCRLVHGEGGKYLILNDARRGSLLRGAAGQPLPPDEVTALHLPLQMAPDVTVTEFLQQLEPLLDAPR